MICCRGRGREAQLRIKIEDLRIAERRFAIGVRGEFAFTSFILLLCINKEVTRILSIVVNIHSPHACSFFSGEKRTNQEKRSCHNLKTSAPDNTDTKRGLT